MDCGNFGFRGFWIVGILDFGDFGVWILGVLDFGFWGFWILVILVLLGRSRGCTTRQFGDGAWRSEARTSETGGAGSKDYILHIFTRFLGVYMHV